MKNLNLERKGKKYLVQKRLQDTISPLIESLGGGQMGGKFNLPGTSTNLFLKWSKSDIIIECDPLN